MFKNIRIVILFDMLLSPSFKVTTSFINIRIVILFDMLLSPSFKMTTSFINICLKLGLRNISKRITILIFLNIYTHCFKIIDKANSKFDLKIKEAFHINWRKPNLNSQQNHLALTLSLELLFPLLLSVFVCFSVIFCNSLSSVVFIISTLIISFFYCLTYTLLLHHLFIAHPVIDFIYKNYAINICPRQLL